MQSLEVIRTAGDNDQDESAVFAQGKAFFTGKSSSFACVGISDTNLVREL